MKIEMFAHVELKTGQTGYVVEIFKDGEAYMVELDKKTAEEWLLTVFAEDIARVIEK